MTDYQKCLVEMVRLMVRGSVIRFRHMLNLSMVFVFVSRWRLHHIFGKEPEGSPLHPKSNSDYFNKIIDYNLDQCPPQQPGGGWDYYGIPVGQINSQYYWDEMEWAEDIEKHIQGRAR